MPIYRLPWDIYPHFHLAIRFLLPSDLCTLPAGWIKLIEPSDVYAWDGGSPSKQTRGGFVLTCQ